jgi:nicotinamidase-related amidase
MKKVFIILCMILPAGILFSQEESVKEPAKPALLVIDIQNEFLKYMSDEDKKFGLEMINYTVWLFRQHDMPVIRVYHTDPQWGPEPGSEGFKFPESIAISETDREVVKNFPSAFKKTELDQILKDSGCNTLFLCGLSATGCVLASYFGAQDRGYNVFMIKGAIMSDNAELTDAVENICETVSWDTMKLMLEMAD